MLCYFKAIVYVNVKIKYLIISSCRVFGMLVFEDEIVD
jgi:hypothetical protein